MATWSIAKNFGSNDAYTVRLDVIGAEQSVENNQTALHFACYLISNRPSASFTGQARTDTLTVAGVTVHPAHGNYVLQGGSSLLLWKYDMTVVHDSDGTFLNKAVSCGVLIDTTFSSSGYIGTVTADGIMTLATIPRASTIGATDANIGATSMIAVTRKSSAYTHSIQYVFGPLSGYVTSSGVVSTTEPKFTNTSIAFTVPTSFYEQIPNSKAGTCTLIIRTYSGTTQIGDAQACTFTATASESNCKPTVSGTVVDSNDTTKALTGDASKLVRYYSTALCTIEATAKNSATISSKAIGGATVSGYNRSIPNVENGSVAFSATDSRGYSSSATVNAKMVSYVKLTNNSTGTRTDPTSGNATLNLKGNYYNGSFGAVNNTLEIKYRIAGGEYISVTPTISSNTYSASIHLTGLDYTQAYNYEVVVSDKLASVSNPVTIGKGVPVFDWGETDMNIHVPMRMDAPLGVESGGTGANTADGARTSLMDLGDINGDLDNMTSIGASWCDFSYCTNAPFSSGYGYVIRDCASGSLTQTAFRYDIGMIYRRSHVNGAWTKWRNGFDVGAVTATTYPPEAGIYVVTGAKIFQNMTPYSLQGVLLIFRAGYSAHIYIDSDFNLYYGFSGNTFAEPAKWYTPSVSQKT